MTDDGSSDNADAIQREHSLWDAYASRDRARLEDLILPDALDVGASGIKRRDEALAAVENMEIAAFELRNFHRQRVADGVEIVTYLATVDGAYHGAPFPASDVLATSVWVSIGGTWKLVHRNEVAARSAGS